MLRLPRLVTQISNLPYRRLRVWILDFLTSVVRLTKKVGLFDLRRAFVGGGCTCLLTCSSAFAQHQLSSVSSSNGAPIDAELAIKSFQVVPGLKVDLWAAEPMVFNPVAFNFDEKGRVYVCETFRLGAGVDDIRGIMDWLDEELASRTVDERLAEMKRHLGSRFATYSEKSERIRLLEDRSGSGKADHSTIFAEGFNTPLDGIAAGVLARKGNVWYANIPNLWLLRDTNADGVADFRKSLHYGFGVRVGFLGHDLHGLTFGPDGKLYFSIGDRGSNVKLADGRHVGEPDSGCVFRCNPDGSDLEVFSCGLRNPQDLVFDEYGNLFTGDNNSDSGDEARWVYVVEGGDNGWRVGYQFMENPYSRGPFNAEKLWYPQFEGQAAYIVPPIANISSGPSGVAYFPGTGFPASYQKHFFLVDFRGGAANSGIHSFTLKPRGAGFELANPEHLIWNVLPTDVKFGVDGGIYFSDWIGGWDKPGKGRIYRIHDPNLDHDRLILETKRLLAEGMERRSFTELASLLSHPDMRVRQEAQFELADRGLKAVATLVKAGHAETHQLARLHAIWGLGQIISNFQEPASASELNSAHDFLMQALTDKDPEVRVQSAKVLGESWKPHGQTGLARPVGEVVPVLLQLLRDKEPRVRFFAAMSAGKIAERELSSGRSASSVQVLGALKQMLLENEDRDPWLRHAAVMALTRAANVEQLTVMATNNSRSIRIAALLAMRRLHRGEIAMFLKDTDSGIVLEAARAINDEPVNGASADLAAIALGRASAEPLVRRVLNANFHLGTTDAAKRLASFANNGEGSESMRIEALEELAQWAHPSGRDRVVGLWRPVAATRSADIAADALQPLLSEIIKAASEKVGLAAIQTAAQLGMSKATSILADLVANTNAPAEIRVEALKGVAALDKSRLEDPLAIARSDSSEELRKAAATLEVLSGSSKTTARLAATLDRGTKGEKQAALLALGSVDDPAADDLLSQWLDNLQKGNVPAELQLDLLDAAAKRSSPKIKQQLEQYQASKPKDDPLAEYRETLFGGSSRLGKKIFFDKPEAQCVRCHRINGVGADVGPDLSHIAGQKDREYLLESIVLPNKQIAQGFDSVMVTLNNDETYAGVLKSETPDQMVINSPQTGVMTIKKSDIQSRKKSLSPMPEGIGQILSKQDIRNLVEFLASLK